MLNNFHIGSSWLEKFNLLNDDKAVDFKWVFVYFNSVPELAVFLH